MLTRKRQTRDIHTDWKDENVHVHLTGEGWLRAIETNKKAERLVQEALARAKGRARSVTGRGADGQASA